MFSTEPTVQSSQEQNFLERGIKTTFNYTHTLILTNWNQKITFYFESVILIIIESISIQHLLMILTVVRGRIITEMVRAMIFT